MPTSAGQSTATGPYLISKEPSLSITTRLECVHACTCACVTTHKYMQLCVYIYNMLMLYPCKC